MSSLDPELIRHTLTIAREQGFAEVELGLGEATFFARLEPSAPSRAAAPAVGGTAEPLEIPLAVIKAPQVGYYRDAKKPLAVGETVKKGDVVAIIAALGIATEIESTTSGEVVEVLVSADPPVEYGQILARVKPE